MCWNGQGTIVKGRGGGGGGKKKKKKKKKEGFFIFLKKIKKKKTLDQDLVGLGFFNTGYQS